MKKKKKYIKKSKGCYLGNIDKDIKRLKEKMELASNNQEFEKAIELRDKIINLERAGKKQKVSNFLHKSIDIIGIARNNIETHLTIFEVRGSNLDNKKTIILKDVEDIEEDIDLVQKAARIEDIEVEDYDEIKEHKKDILEGYSDYHLDENEIIELEEQNHLDETATDVDIDRLLADISPRNKVKTMNNDVDKFVDEKVEPIEVAVQRVEKHLEEDEVVEEQEEEEIGIDYTEKLYTDDVFDYFDKGNGRKLGEYKTIDHGYRPVSKEKIENNQRILDAIFEKYSNNGISTNKSVTAKTMETSIITPKLRNVGKFKPTPVYSSVYGSGPRKDVEVKSTTKLAEEAGLSDKKSVPVKKTAEPKNKKKSEAKVGKNEQASADIYKEIASQEETVWNIGSAKRVPKSKIKTKKDKK